MKLMRLRLDTDGADVHNTSVVPSVRNMISLLLNVKWRHSKFDAQEFSFDSGHCETD